jgi:prolyl-tRNA synthetase
MKKNITKRDEDYSQWYLDVVESADMAQHSIVRGCMVIKPNGYALWETVKETLDKMIKETGHENAYFPIFIPKSLIAREAEHVKGFAKEMAVVTHHRLIDDGKGGVIVDPEAKLDDELIVRPTSETLIMETYKGWVESYRDLPVLINQWANVVRWEMRTRFFLRTTEFLWQEGHTLHATYEEAMEETSKMLEVYRTLAEDYLAIPVIKGYKSSSERFAGAEETLSIEGMMQDGKALQAGTSHFLGQNFTKAFEIEFTDKDGAKKYPYSTSWGLSTRIIGGLIMTHSDDKGLVVPPKIAHIQIVIVPILRKDSGSEVLTKANEIAELLKENGIKVKVDERDYISPGAKFNEWEKKGIPIRIEIGERDIENNELVIVRRDQEDKRSISIDGCADYISKELDQMQRDLFDAAKNRMDSMSIIVDNYDEFKRVVNEEKGFIYSHWCMGEGCESEIKDETGATTRCRPLDAKKESGKCIKCGKNSDYRWIFAIAY